MTMYNPPAFRVEDRRKLVQFMRRNAFATLVCDGDAGLHVSHVPLLVDEGEGSRLTLVGHEARANGQLEALEGARQVLAIFHGPHAYVSPTWYEKHPAVPTWNYTVVHAHGRARRIGDEALADALARLSHRYEDGRPAPWRMESLDADFRARMMKAIGGFAIEVERLEGKFKLSQNRPASDARRVIEALEAEGEAELAALMREHQTTPIEG